jgi:hypothetical protein
MTRRHTRPRAFATLTALGLVVVVGIAITALTALVAQDVKRSIRQSEEAQVRQLLLAGELAARASLGAKAAGQANVPLPPELSSAGYSLRVEDVTSDDRVDAAIATPVADVHVRVTAYRPDGRTASQHLRYGRTDAGGWQLRTAELQ